MTEVVGPRQGEGWEDGARREGHRVEGKWAAAMISRAMVGFSREQGAGDCQPEHAAWRRQIKRMQEYLELGVEPPASDLEVFVVSVRCVSRLGD